MAEQATDKQELLDRDYRGRKGWGLGAVWDSILYVGRLVRSAIARRIARRKTLKKHADQEKLFELRLVELGRTALYLDGFSPDLISEFEEELKKLELRKSDLEDKLGGVKERLQKHKLETSRRNQELENELQERKGERRHIEEELDPLIAEHREYRSKLQRSEWEIEHLERKTELGDQDLDRLSKEGASVSELSKLRTKLSKWRGEIKEIEHRMPEYRGRIQALKPEITELSEKLEEAKENEEDAKEKLKQQAAEAREKTNSIEGEEEKLLADLDKVADYQRSVFKECGQALNTNRVPETALEGRYGELDAIEKERKRLAARAARLDRPKGEIAWEPIFRFTVVVTSLVLVVLIVLKIAVW
jgi:predicted  nucleic acid-binding Zn-ribbon protein